MIQRHFLFELIFLCIFVNSRQKRHSYQPKTTPKPIPVVSFGETIRFYANDSFLLVKTEELWMDSTQCVEARFRVEGKRTRVKLYTCHMKPEGNGCGLKVSVYKSVSGANYCHQFYPFYPNSEPYTLYATFERRPRKFQDKETELRVRRRRIGRQATREVANFQFIGFVDCSKACQDVSNGDFSTQNPMIGGLNSNLNTAISPREFILYKLPNKISNALSPIVPYMINKFL